ncbi:VOC family protein [Natrialbaceae archaeon A-gly3]
MLVDAVVPDMDALGIDHLVLTVEDIDRTCEFYATAIGATVRTFGEGRTALHVGDQKINLHPAGDEYEPHADRPVPGSEDFCVYTDRPLSNVQNHLEDHDVPIEYGPVEKTGARGPMRSVYVRDPDGNLLEIDHYEESES